MPSQVTVRRGWLPEADLRRFLACARDEVELLWWVLMCDAGLRSHEVRALHWSDLTGRSVRVKGKGRKVRLVPITQRIERVRDAILGRYPFLPTQLICNLSGRSLQRRFDYTCFRAKIRKEKLCPHSLRHTFATRLLAAGVDIHRVGVLLGHASTLTTVGYLHTNEAALSDARDKLDTLNDQKTPLGDGADEIGESEAPEKGFSGTPRFRRIYSEIQDLALVRQNPEVSEAAQIIKIRPSPLDRLDSLL